MEIRGYEEENSKYKLLGSKHNTPHKNLDDIISKIISSSLLEKDSEIFYSHEEDPKFISNIFYEDLTKRARHVDIMDSIFSLAEYYLSKSSILGFLLSMGLKAVELTIKYEYFYKKYWTTSRNPLGVIILGCSEIIRFMGATLNLTGIIPLYYFVTKKETSG